MLPLTAPSMKSAQKMKELAPELAKLKKKWAHNKEKLAKAQMDFYKERGVNPASGCLPQIIQIIGQISASSTLFTQKTPSGKPENVSFSQAEYHIHQLLFPGPETLPYNSDHCQPVLQPQIRPDHVP